MNSKKSIISTCFQRIFLEVLSRRKRCLFYEYFFTVETNFFAEYLYRISMIIGTLTFQAQDSSNDPWGSDKLNRLMFSILVGILVVYSSGGISSGSM